MAPADVRRGEVARIGPTVREWGTIVVLATFRDGYEAHFAEYSARVRAHLERRGARVARRQRVEATLYGDAPAPGA